MSPNPANSVDSSSAGSLSTGRTFVIQATAADQNGVSKVEFYVNNGLVCTVFQAPYSCPWQIPNGSGISYQLKTIAYGNEGSVATSSNVNVTSR